MKKSKTKSPSGDTASPTAELSASQALESIMQDYLRRHEAQVSQSILSIAQDISSLRASLRDSRPQASAIKVSNPLPEVGAELDAVLRDTEDATHIILDTSEALLNLPADHPNLKDAADALVMRIFEACSFQDLVGQRISKIVRLMESIEARVNAPDMPELQTPSRDPLLNGPALNGPEVSQEMIDKMLSEI